MELDFQVREWKKDKTGEAVNVRKPVIPGGSQVQTGKIWALRRCYRDGVISSGGRGYYFRASHLREGLAYDDLYKDMGVMFQVVKGPRQSQNDQATNIDQIRDGTARHMPEFIGASSARGVICELKREGRCGFIRSGGRKCHFHASDLVTGREFTDITEGMEIDFDIILESTDTRCAQARRIRNASDTDQSHTAKAGPPAGGMTGVMRVAPGRSHEIAAGLIQQGQVRLFRQSGRFGFVSANGREYYFRGIRSPRRSHVPERL